MYLSIVAVENNRITKYAKKATQEEAQAHCDEFGGFVYEGSYSPDLYVEGQTVTVQAITVPVPPITVSPWQFRKALNQLGLRQQVEDAVAAADQDLKDGWEFATEFVRTDPLVISMGQALGKTDEEMDQLFELAKAT